MATEYTVTFANLTDAEEIMRVINDAYSVETGSTGVSFKTMDRLLEPLEHGFKEAYEENRILKVVTADNVIVGALFFEIREHALYFGPFAVSSVVKGQGIGKLLLKELALIAERNNRTAFEIRVINHRSDLLPMYKKWGFTKVGEEAYPHPERLTRPSHFEVLRVEVAEFVKHI